MTNLIALALFTALVLGVIAALQHNHRRMPYGAVPFGFDAERIGDRDNIRVEHDLDAIAAHGSSTGPQRERRQASNEPAGADRIAVSSVAARRA